MSQPILKDGDIIILNMPIYRRKYWFFGKMIKCGYRKQSYTIRIP